MELIVINENKLKILMSRTDMERYGLDENEFYCSVINTREILDRILHNTPIKTGFENISADDKILIQLYPDKNGGCELYVTKISLDEKGDALFMTEEREERYLLPRPTQKKQVQKYPPISYRFEKLESVIDVAKELMVRSFKGESSFFCNSDGKYYLFVNPNQMQSADLHIYTDFLSEFGEVTNAENSYLTLLEYGNCIFKQNAVEQLCEI